MKKLWLKRGAWKLSKLKLKENNELCGDFLANGKALNSV